jgi:hypothetical protein
MAEDDSVVVARMFTAIHCRQAAEAAEAAAVSNSPQRHDAHQWQARAAQEAVR